MVAEMLQLEQAIEKILGSLPAPDLRVVPLSQAAGCWLAAPVFSQADLPAFDNSSMDGYAVRGAETEGARPEAPVALRVAGRSVAGRPLEGELAPGTCARIFTGAAIPAGADAVVMQEDTAPDPAAAGRVLIQAPAHPGENVRRAGEDLRAGERLVGAGERLTAGALMALAAAGVAEATVGCAPRVALAATGSELLEPGQPLRPGMIYESARVGLAEMVRATGSLPVALPLTPDDAAATRRTLAEAFERAEIVISTGGVSVGETDLVKAAFTQLGGRTEFWRVDIKPGKPFLFGRLGEKRFFGLPGNPVSAAVTFFLLARPALLRLQGARDVRPRACVARLGEPLANPGDRRHFLRVALRGGLVFSAGLQASHGLRALAGADALLDAPAGARWPAGAEVQVLPLD